MPNLTLQRVTAMGHRVNELARRGVKEKGSMETTFHIRNSRGASVGRLWCGVLLIAVAPLSHGQSVTQYSYDAGDHVTNLTDARGLITTYVYDGLDQRWQKTSPDTGTTNLSYDGYGRLSSMTRADGSQTTYGYDGINRRTSTSVGGLTQTSTYDSCTNGIGRLCSASDATGTTSYAYSPEGWLTGRSFSISGTAYSLGYAYNALGQVSAVVYPDGNQVLYTYGYGSISTVQVKVGNTTFNAATNITYQPKGTSMVQWTSGNGITNSLSYDTDGRLTGISASGVQNLGLTYDAANRVNGVINGVDSAMTQSIGYDAMSRLTSVYSDADSETMQYDADGNRISQALNGVSAIVAPSATSNQILSLSGGVNTTYGYDAKGNLTTVSGTPTFAYDAFNRLSSAGGATYYVGPEGQRLRKTVSGSSTYFAPDIAGPMMAENSGSGWNDYVWLNGRLIGRIVSGQLQAIHDDQVGRPEAITDSNQVVVWRARNFAFDRTVTVANVVPLNLGFPGQYYDAESGLWSNGFRDYSPGLGRYIESDPLGQVAGTNTYVYVGGNPLSHSDPLGLETGVAFSAINSGGPIGLPTGSPAGPQGSYVPGAAAGGVVFGAAIGGIIVANVIGFPEVEIGEAAALAMGADGVAALELMDVLAGEPAASIAVGSVNGAAYFGSLGAGAGLLVDNATKKNCP